MYIRVTKQLKKSWKFCLLAHDDFSHFN